MEYYSINRDIKNHFDRFPKYITPRGVIFYDKWSYDVYMNNEDINDIGKKYKIVLDVKASKK
jgi:hypothetical protein